MAAPKPIKAYDPGVAPAKTSGYASPVPSLIAVGRGDHGQDYQGKVGTSVVAIGNGTVTAVLDDPTGFGKEVVYLLTSGKYKGTYIYVGHALPTVKVGDPLVAGVTSVAKLVNAGTIAGSNATQDGWTEVGIATASGSPAYSKDTGGAMFKQLMGTALTPTEKGAVSVAQTQATGQQLLNTPGAIDTAAQVALAKATTLASLKVQQKFETWVTLRTDKNGQVQSFGYVGGLTAPKATKTSQPFLVAGEPITKEQLAQLWDSRYASTFLDFTGKQATPNDIHRIVDSGITPYGLQTQLSQTKGFTASPIYKAHAAGYQDQAKQVLGKAAPDTFIRKAIAENWDTDTFNANIRTLDGGKLYQQGPVFKQNFSDMKGLYQSIYGVADASATDTIKQHTLQGWKPQEFGQYLRTLPQYKSSPEAQATAVSFLDGMGLLTGSRPVLTPNKAGSLTPKLAGAPGLTA